MMHNHPQDVGVTHWKPGSGVKIDSVDQGKWPNFCQLYHNLTELRWLLTPCHRAL